MLISRNHVFWLLLGIFFNNFVTGILIFSSVSASNFGWKLSGPAYFYSLILYITVVTAFFMSTETHAKRFLTVWKRSVSTTLKRSFTVLANQIIVSETFQAFQILTNHISVRKTLSWKPCLVSNVLAFAELAIQNPADSIYFTSFFFFFSNFT